MNNFDAVVIGSGPNGYAAAIAMQQQGLSVLILEAEQETGGGTRSAALTLPGFVHDLGSTIHPLGAGSPFLSTLPLDRFGLEWVYPTHALAHPLDNGEAVLLKRSVAETAQQFGKDAGAYQRLMQPVVDHWDDIAPDFLGPLPWPKHPVQLAQFGLRALQSAEGLAYRTFEEAATRAFIAGLAAHVMLPLNSLASSAIALVLGALGHRIGWPFPKGGAQAITRSMDGYFKSLGGRVETGRRVQSMADIPTCKAMLFDITPKQLLNIKGLSFSTLYRKQLEHYQYGQGIFKIDWALDSPIPFSNPACGTAATMHLGGTLEEIALSERLVWQKKHPEKPYVLLVQQTQFDSSRAPEGKHTAWAYCHVPRYSQIDMTAAIEQQVERFAPGFSDTILARHTMHAVQVEQFNANYIGGDINGGAQTIFQQFTRPSFRLKPYRTSVKNVYICSSSTPPGGGVHGMCGYHAARIALKDHF